VDLSTILSENLSDFLITYFKCVSFFCSRAIISGLMGNSSDYISLTFIM
jgi:hypothetical protein